MDVVERFGERAHDFHHQRATFLDGFLAGHHRVDVILNLLRADVEQIAEAQLLGFLDQWFAEKGKLRDVVRQGGESLGVFSGGDDLGIFFGIDAKAAQRQAQCHVRSRAQAVDATDLAFELLDGRDVSQRNNVIDEQRQIGRDHDRVGAGEARSDQRCRRRDDKIDFAGKQRLDDDGAGADVDDLRVKPILFKKAFLIGDPDRRVRRRAAGPGDAHALLGGSDAHERYAENEKGNQWGETTHKILLTSIKDCADYSVCLFLLSIRGTHPSRQLASRRDRVYDAWIVGEVRKQLTRSIRIGAGQVGGVIGGRLVRAGDDVTLCDVDLEHVEAIGKNGLRVDLPNDFQPRHSLMERMATVEAMARGWKDEKETGGGLKRGEKTEVDGIIGAVI